MEALKIRNPTLKNTKLNSVHQMDSRMELIAAAGSTSFSFDQAEYSSLNKTF